MKTGQSGPMAAAPTMITADGGAGCHRGVSAPVRFPARDHGLAVQAPGRPGSPPGVPWRDRWARACCGPAMRVLATADAVMRYPVQAVRRAGPPAVPRVRETAERMQPHLPVAGGRALGGDARGCSDAVRAGSASGIATNASGRCRVLAPRIWRGSEVPGGGWLPGGAAGTGRCRAAVTLRALTAVGSIRRLSALSSSPRHERTHHAGFGDSHVLAQ